MVRIVASVLALMAFVSCGARREVAEEKSLYERELVGRRWSLPTPRGTFTVRFDRDRIRFDIGRLGNRFAVATTDDARRMVIVEHRGRYVPMWWRVAEDGSVRISRLDGQRLYGSVEEALAAPLPEEWLVLVASE